MAAIEIFVPNEAAFNELLASKKDSISTTTHLLKERLKLLDYTPRDPFDIFRCLDSRPSFTAQIASKELSLHFYNKMHFDIQTAKTLKYYDNEALFELYWSNPCDRFLQKYDRKIDYFATFKAKYEYCIRKRILLEIAKPGTLQGISADMMQAGLCYAPCILSLPRLPIEMQTSASERFSKIFD
jgi:hypothetical protein